MSLPPIPCETKYLDKDLKIIFFLLFQFFEKKKLHLDIAERCEEKGEDDSAKKKEKKRSPTWHFSASK